MLDCCWKIKNPCYCRCKCYRLMFNVRALFLNKKHSECPTQLNWQLSLVELSFNKCSERVRRSEHLLQLNSTQLKKELKIAKFFCQSQSSEHFHNWLSWVESGASGRTVILVSEEVKFIRMFAGDHSPSCSAASVVCWNVVCIQCSVIHLRLVSIS